MPHSNKNLTPKKVVDKNNVKRTVYVNPNKPAVKKSVEKPVQSVIFSTGSGKKPGEEKPDLLEAYQHFQGTKNVDTGSEDNKIQEEEFTFEHKAHDYDPTWDYNVRFDQFNHPLAVHAQNHADTIVAATNGQKAYVKAHVYPVSFEQENPGNETIAVYCFGTAAEPVILIDVDAHERAYDSMVKNAEEEGYTIDMPLEGVINHTIEHELRHADQEIEWDGESDPSEIFDEHEAEYGF